MANPEHLEILKKGVEAWNRWRERNPGLWPDLVRANLRGLNLYGVNFFTTDLREANLSGCDLRGANLSGSILIWADISDADLRGADLYIANMNGAKLRGADLEFASMGVTILVNVDLRGVRGLEKVRHYNQSHVGIDTIYRSEGDIPEAFLRGCGVPDAFIRQVRTLTAAVRPIQFNSCFISYSSKDHEFAERLHTDLQTKDVRVWFAPHDLPIGARIRPSIDESIRAHDKLLLVLSEASVGSQWVEQEVETALAKERESESRTVLFPIRIDDAVLEGRAGWPALLKNTRNVGDFTRWKEHDSYQKAFDRLLRDLKAEV